MSRSISPPWDDSYLTRTHYLSARLSNEPRQGQLVVHAELRSKRQDLPMRNSPKRVNTNNTTLSATGQVITQSAVLRVIASSAAGRCRPGPDRKSAGLFQMVIGWMGDELSRHLGVPFHAECSTNSVPPMEANSLQPLFTVIYARAYARE